MAQAFAVSGTAAVKDAVLSGVLPVRSAAVVISEADKLLPLVTEEARPTVLDGLIRIAAQEGPRECRRLRPELLARYGVDGQLQREQDAAKRFVALSQPFVDDMGVAEYRLTLDPEGKAVLEAALGPLSAPRPVRRGARPALERPPPGRGPGDVGAPGRRVVRADAEGCEVAAVRHGRPRDAAKRGDAAAGEVLAGTQAGDPVGARDGAPVGLRRVDHPHGDGGGRGGGRPGAGGAAVHAGAGASRLWLRDRHCTYPGCDDAWSSWAMRITWCTGPMAARRICRTPRCCANGTTRSCTAAGTPGGWSRTSVVRGSSGTVGRLLRPSCSPGSPPDNQRDPAPHPAHTGGVHRHVRTRVTARLTATPVANRLDLGRPGRRGWADEDARARGNGVARTHGGGGGPAARPRGDLPGAGE